jgi:WD40 repeat protein
MPGGIKLEDCNWVRAVSPDLRRLVGIDAGEKMVKIWDSARGREGLTLGSHDWFEHARGAAFNPDGKFLATGGRDARVRLWNFETFREVRVFRGLRETVRGVAFSPDGESLAAGGDDSTLRLWDVKTGRLASTFEVPQGDIHCLAWSPDRRRLVAGGGGGARNTAQLKVWDLNSGKSTDLLGHSDTIWDVAWSSDGVLLASASTDGTARLWDSRTLACLGTLQGQTVALSRIAFSPDGRRVATGGYRTVWVWDAASKTVIHKFHGLDPAPYCLAFSPHGRWLLAVAYRGQLVVWDTMPGPPAASGPARIPVSRSSRRTTRIQSPSQRLP